MQKVKTVFHRSTWRHIMGNLQPPNCSFPKGPVLTQKATMVGLRSTTQEIKPRMRWFATFKAWGRGEDGRRHVPSFHFVSFRLSYPSAILGLLG